MSSFRHDLPTAAAARSASERRGAATEFGANPANRRAVVVRFFTTEDADPNEQRRLALTQPVYMAVWLEADRRARGRSVPRIDQLEEEAVVGGMWSQQNHVTDSKSTWRRLPASKRTRSPVYTRRLQLPCDFSPTAVRLRQYPGNLTITEPVVYYFANKSEKLLKWVDFFHWVLERIKIGVFCYRGFYPNSRGNTVALPRYYRNPLPQVNLLMYNIQYTTCSCILYVVAFPTTLLYVYYTRPNVDRSWVKFAEDLLLLGADYTCGFSLTPIGAWAASGQTKTTSRFVCATQCVSAVFAVERLLAGCLDVCHTPVLCLNG